MSNLYVTIHLAATNTWKRTYKVDINEEECIGYLCFNSRTEQLAVVNANDERVNVYNTKSKDKDYYAKGIANLLYNYGKEIDSEIPKITYKLVY